ncbi:MAG TPA: ABC transporter substrate-binding protein [Dehalococcoidia bacterium]|nr:ABC transporter substrate-binding protein [Dehalococcoidia bacterium]
MANYWTRVLAHRTSRRRAIAATGASAAAAAFLAACGGSSNNNTGSSSASGAGATSATSGASGATGGSGASGASGGNGLVYTPVDTTAQAKPGGTLKYFATADITTFDSLADNGSPPLSQSAAFAYPRLAKYKIVNYPDQYSSGSFEGDLAESWEISPDKLSITFKLRQGVKWDPRPPTNSRVADANDVVQSWNKFISINPGATSYHYNADSSPSSPIESLTATDNNTIVVKLHQPDASTIALFAGTTFSPMPKEFDGGFDPKTTVRGHGPWMLDNYTPSVGFTWVKNPNYYVQGRPFYDKIEVPIVPEYATRLAQFRTGGIYTDVISGFGGNQGDLVPTKKSLDATRILVASTYPQQASWQILFGWDGNAPFKDVRMRQAVSMIIDREGIMDAIDNRDGFAKEGLDLDDAYNTIIPAGFTGYWIDPTDAKNFGDNAKYFTTNVAEAKKLMSAAGYNGGAFPFHYNSSSQFPIEGRYAELYNAMLLDAGLKPTLDGIPNGTTYSDTYTYGYVSKLYASGQKKGYDGMAMGQERPYATAALLISLTLDKDGSYYHGMSPDGNNVANGDPKVNDWAKQIKQEFDLQKQQDLTHDLIKYFSGQCYYIPQPSAAKAFSLYWPVVGNLGAFSNGVSPNYWTESYLNWWIDSSKPPLA